MFKFDFEIEDDSEPVVPAPAAPARASAPCHSISLSELIRLLPPSFSYTPLAHPSGGAPLLRRDLFDARFQIAQGEREGAEAAGEEKEAYIDADTDLIPGTYEGGLKSWEGGVDLVEVLSGVPGEGGEEERVAAWVRGHRVLEVGCGTGLPTAYILRSLLSAPTTDSSRTVLHLQDYNLPVLSLVTLPNLVLAALPALPPSARTAEADPEEREDDDDSDEEADVTLPFDPSRAGNLDVTPALLEGFTALLEERGIELRFTYGDWSGMAETLQAEEGYDLVLTAETIYAEESVHPLIDVLRAATVKKEKKEKGQKGEKGEKEEKEEKLEDSLENLTLGLPALDEPVILVAAKVLYFGVGGGLEAFLALVRAQGGWSARVKSWVRGVGRAVVRVGW